MPIDASIPLSYKPIDGMANLSSLLDTRRKMLELNKSTDTYDSDVAKAKAESSTAQSASTVNAANIGAMIRQRTAESSTAESAATVNAANVNPLINAQAAATSTAQTGAQSAQFGLDQKKTQAAQQAMMELLQNKNINNADPATYDKKEAMRTVASIRNYMIANGQDPHKVESISARLMTAGESVGGIKAMMQQIIRAGSTPTDNATIGNPNIQSTDVGNAVNRSDNNPMSQTHSGDATSELTKGMPPTTTLKDGQGRDGYYGPNATTPTAKPQQPIYKPPPASGFNASKGDALLGNVPPEPGTLPATPEQEARARMVSDIAGLKREIDIAPSAKMKQILSDELSKKESLLSQNDAKPTPGFVASGMPPGQADSIASTQKGINDHFADLQAKSSTASQDIAILQNIAMHAKGASTGIGSDKLAIQQAIFGKLGLDSAKASTMDYEMLGKNVAMIQLAGGDTNMAKTLAGFANPSSHMSEAGIKEAVQQLIGPKKMALAAMGLFQPLKAMSDRGHPAAYNDMMPKFSAANDSRIMQLSDMTDEQKKKMKASMSPSQSAKFKKDILDLESMGIRP